MNVEKEKDPHPHLWLEEISHKMNSEKERVLQLHLQLEVRLRMNAEKERDVLLHLQLQEISHRMRADKEKGLQLDL